MNLIEAVKSGKKFKRKKNISWVRINEHHESPQALVYDSTEPVRINYLSVNDILADDWEVEEKPFECYMWISEAGEYSIYAQDNPRFRKIKMREVKE